MKTLKICGVAALILIVLVLSAIGIAMYVIFTPAKITPVVTNLLQENMQAGIRLDAVELTFFSTFPDFGLKLRNGSLVSHATYIPSADTSMSTDSLLSFRECLIRFNLIAWFMNREIRVHEISLTDPVIHAYIDSTGRANWEVMNPEEDSSCSAKPGDTASTREELSIQIKKVAIRNGKLTFLDRTTDLYFRLQDITFLLRGFIHKKQSDLEVHFSATNIHCRHRNEVLADGLTFGFDSDLDLDDSLNRLNVNRASLTLNSVNLVASGSLVEDTLTGNVCADLRFGLHAASIKEILRMFPPGIVDQDVPVEAGGEVNAEAEVKGIYGKDQIPLITGKIQIKDGYARYGRLPGSIDHLEAEINFLVDVTKKQPSRVDVGKFVVHCGSSQVDLQGQITHLLTNPDCRAGMMVRINFSELSQIFPMEEGVTLEGMLTSSLNLHFRLADLAKQDFGKLDMTGEMEMNGVKLESSKDTFLFAMNQSVLQVGTPSIDSTRPEQMNLFQGRVTLNEMRLRVGHALRADLERLELTFTTPEPDDMSSITPVSAHALIRNLQAFSPFFPLDVHLDHSALTLTPEQFHLENATVRIGNSDLVLSGMLRFPSFMGNRTEKLQARLHLESDLLDLNELAEAMNQGNRYAHGEGGQIEESSGLMAIDSSGGAASEGTLREKQTTFSAFLVPADLDLAFDARIHKALFDVLVIDSIRGRIEIRDQSVDLKELWMSNQGAAMKTSLLYRAPAPDDIYLGLDLDITDIDLGILTKMIPSLDTLLPMMNSLEGKVDFRMAAETNLDTGLSIILETLRGAASLQADSLVVLSSADFEKIAKMLFFKNKQRNLIDSVSAEILLTNGVVEVFPFLLQADVYKVAVGGVQTLDLNFHYHVSMLKPLRISMDITGNPDHMKFNLVKSRYRDLFVPSRRGIVDSSAWIIRQKIREELTRN